MFQKRGAGCGFRLMARAPVGARSETPLTTWTWLECAPQTGPSRQPAAMYTQTTHECERERCAKCSRVRGSCGRGWERVIANACVRLRNAGRSWKGGVSNHNVSWNHSLVQKRERAVSERKAEFACACVKCTHTNGGGGGGGGEGDWGLPTCS